MIYICIYVCVCVAVSQEKLHMSMMYRAEAVYV